MTTPTTKNTTVNLIELIDSIITLESSKNPPEESDATKIQEPPPEEYDVKKSQEISYIKAYL